MKRYLTALLALILLAACVPAANADSYSLRVIVSDETFIQRIDRYLDVPDGYTGIYNADDLQKIVANPGGKFILMNNMYLNHRESLLKSLNAITFRGLLEGNGYNVYWDNVTYTLTEGMPTMSCGLFSCIDGGQVSNLYVSGTITLDMDERLLSRFSSFGLGDLAEYLGAWGEYLGEWGDFMYGAMDSSPAPSSDIIETNIYLGGVAGALKNDAQVYNCSASVSYEAEQDVAHALWDAYQYDTTPFYMGGVVGSTISGTPRILYCRNIMEVGGFNNVGGILGADISDGAILLGCENVGKVKGEGFCVGGIAGYLQCAAEVRSCGNLGEVYGDNEVGGIVGYFKGSGVVADCANVGNVWAKQNSFTVDDWLTRLAYAALEQADYIEDTKDDVFYGLLGGMLGDYDSYSSQLQQELDEVRGTINDYLDAQGELETSVPDLVSCSYFRYEDIAVGGIVGYGEVSVRRCVNFEEVEATYYGGMGICGHNAVSNIQDCYMIDSNAWAVGEGGHGISVSASACQPFSEGSGESFFARLNFGPLDWLVETSLNKPFPAALCYDRWLRYDANTLRNDIYGDLTYLYHDAEKEAALSLAMEIAANQWDQPNMSSPDDSYKATLDRTSLAGTVMCFLEGYGEHPDCGKSNQSYSRTSAMAVVYKGGKIVFATGKCATFPDYPMNPSNNGSTSGGYVIYIDGVQQPGRYYDENMPTVQDGIYRLESKMHAPDGSNYAAMNIQHASAIRVVRNSSTPNGMDYHFSYSTGTNLHQISANTLGREKTVVVDGKEYKKWANSTGCTIVGEPRNGATRGVYSRFGYLIGFAYESSTAGYGKTGKNETYRPTTAICVHNRSIGYDHVAAFRDGFNERYSVDNVPWMEVINLIMRR